MSRLRLGRIAALSAGVLCALALYASPALAAGPPTVELGKATKQLLNTATVTATVNPNGAKTFYEFYFDGTGSPSYYTGTVGAGTTPVTLTFDLVGMKPQALHSYEILAYNSYGEKEAAGAVQLTQAWHVEGKLLSELKSPEFTEYLTKNGSTTISFAYNSHNWAVVCGESGSGELNMEAKVTVPFSGCKTYRDGTWYKGCVPEEEEPAVYKLNGYLAPPVSAGSFVLSFSTWDCNSSTLPMYNVVPYTGFAIETGPESVELPVTLTTHTKLESGAGKIPATVTVKSTWYQIGEYIGGKFGVW